MGFGPEDLVHIISRVWFYGLYFYIAIYDIYLGNIDIHVLSNCLIVDLASWYNISIFLKFGITIADKYEDERLIWKYDIVKETLIITFLWETCYNVNGL